MAKIRAKSKALQWKEGLLAIDRNIDAMRDDLHDKGWDDEVAIESTLNRERAEMMSELSRNIDGDYSQPYEYKRFIDLNDIKFPDELINSQERASAGENNHNQSLEDYNTEPIPNENDNAEELASDLLEDLSFATEDYDIQEELASDLVEGESSYNSFSEENDIEEGESYSY